LAATLLAIADGGADAFYRGALAAKLLAGVERLGGIWQRADLESYRAIARQPVELSYRGHQVLTMPPPSGGGVVLAQLLHAAERFDFAAQPWRDPLSTHRYIEAARRAYADRNSLVADPDHVRVPLAELLSREYAQGRMADIGERATDSRTIAAGLAAPESEETTHLSVVDGDNNAVSCTTTLNAGFGAKVVESTTGVLLNNEMDDFSAAPGKPNLYGLVQGEANAIAPGKRMLSSMTPTIVLRDGAPRLLLGSPGGPTITNTVAQILLAVIDHGMALDAAVAAARLHHQWLPDRVFVEAELAPDLVAALEARGHQVEVRPAIGVANCIEIDPLTRGFRSVADVARDGGKAAAY
jgi:gamma-glutamyltranspeptidase/glutathione hydrolase